MRTPRSDYKTALSTKKIQDLLPDIVSQIGKKGGQQREAIFALWKTLLGEKMAPLTEPISLVDGVLTIKVKSATLYSLLSVYEKARLLKQMQEKFPIRNIIFRSG